MTSVSRCHGFGCGSTSPIRAHLVPQSFGRLIKSPSGPNTRISERKYTTKAQHGLFDPRILCGDCDGFLNMKYDDPAFRFISKFEYRPGELDLERSYFEKPSVDCDMLCGFILSVLWRCSISQMFEVSNISLRPVRKSCPRDALGTSISGELQPLQGDGSAISQPTGRTENVFSANSR